MPDLGRPLRRLTTARATRRAIKHLSVIGLVAVTASVGIAVAQTPERSSGSPVSLALVGRAQAAGETQQPQLDARTYQLQPNPSAPEQLPRSAVRTQATAPPSPLPTPVAPPSATPVPVQAAPPVVAARPAGNGALLWPVSGGTITTYYSAAHLAIDIAVPYGTTVVAADGGVVTWAGWRNNGGGYVVSIDHGNGITTVYNHLSAIWVSVGQAVSRGQGIAAVGCTGMCTGPHVHFEVIVDGVLVNPLRYL